MDSCLRCCVCLWWCGGNGPPASFQPMVSHTFLFCEMRKGLYYHPVPSYCCNLTALCHPLWLPLILFGLWGSSQDWLRGQ